FFAISGVQVAQALGHGGVIAVLMGTITGVAGGAIRDVLTAQIPLVMRHGELYATAAASGAALYLVLDTMGLPRLVAEGSGMALVALLRFGAMRWRWELPVLRMAPDDPVVGDVPRRRSDES